MQKEEVQKATRMSERLKAMEKDLTLEKPLGKAKERLCTNIVDSVNDIWPYIQVTFEQIHLIKLATEAIWKVKIELCEMLEEATRIIQFLNAKNRYKLQELGIDDRIDTILKVKRVLSKRNLMQSVE